MKRLRRCAALLAVCALLCTGTAGAEDGLWGLEAMGFDLLLEAAQGDPAWNRPMLAAVLDTGCDVNHAVFRGRISPESRSFMPGGGDIADGGGHGTAVASVIARATPPSVQLLILKVGDNGAYAPDAQFTEAILYALQQGADVICMSIRVRSDSPVQEDFRPWGEAIRRCEEQGVPFVTGAGNDRSDTACMYPAAGTRAIAVSAVGRDGRLNPDSNHGAAIRFCGPGTRVSVAQAGTADGYTLSGGTSLAAPFIAAAALWVKLRQPDATVEEVCAALKEGTADPGDPGWDDRFGDGLPRPSLSLLGEMPRRAFPAPPAALPGNATPGFDGEGPENLFCGDDLAKWCLYIGDGVFVEWEQTEPLAPGFIVLVTGNDCSTQPGRNPAGAVLYARSDPAEEWQRIWQQPEDSRIPDTDLTPWAFQIPGTDRVYRYFRLEIPRTAGSDVLQLARVELTE